VLDEETIGLKKKQVIYAVG